MVFALLYGVKRRFQRYFSDIAGARAPTHAFLKFFWPVLHIVFFPSHWLLSNMTFAETAVRETWILSLWLTSIFRKNLAVSGIEPATFCSRVLYATNWARRARLAIDLYRSSWEFLDKQFVHYPNKWLIDRTLSGQTDVKYVLQIVAIPSDWQTSRRSCGAILSSTYDVL